MKRVDFPSTVMPLVLSDAGQAPEWVHLLSMGLNRSTAGDFIVDDRAIAMVMDWFATLGHDLVIDYEHQTLGGAYSSPDGTAPAAAWIKALERRDDGLWARIDWTAKASQMVVNKEYRFHSPVVVRQGGTGRAMALHSVALTNAPAILGSEPIVNKAGFNEEDMVKNRLLALLALPADATDDQIVAAAQGLANFRNEAVTVLELKDGTPSELKGTVLALKQRPEGVSAETVADLQRRLNERDALDLVDKGQADGKFTPAQRDSMLVLARTDRVAFATFIEKAPRVVPVDQVAKGRAPVVGAGQDDALVIACKQMGLTPEFVKKCEGEV